MNIGDEMETLLGPGKIVQITGGGRVAVVEVSGEETMTVYTVYQRIETEQHATE